MSEPLEIITNVLDAGIIGENPGAPYLVAGDIIEHLESAGYTIRKVSLLKRCADLLGNYPCLVAALHGEVA